MAEDDPFGKPYKILRKKLKGLSAMSRMEPDVVGQIIDGLFPQQPPPMVALPIVEKDGISLLGTEEVDAAVNRLRDKYWKAPCPDEIPNLVWSTKHSVDPALLVDSCWGTVPCAMEESQASADR